MGGRSSEHPPLIFRRENETRRAANRLSRCFGGMFVLEQIFL